MLVQLLTLILAPASAIATTDSPEAVIVSLEQPGVTGIRVRPPVVVATADRMVPNATPEAQVYELSVRVSSPAGLLWQGNLRVAQNQGANYSQNLNQASPVACPSNSSGYDRSERSSISFNVYVQNSGEYGPVYRLDASWQRPTEEGGCGERGTRTVQVSKGLALSPGESGVIEGDAGLKVEVTRRR